MYSIVLLAAMSTGAEGPAFGHGNGCWLDSCCPMRYGWVSCGCHGWGSGCYGCFGGCHGCWGGCYGCYGSCFGCYGGCYGSSCHGYIWPLAYGVYPPLQPYGGYGLYPSAPAPGMLLTPGGPRAISPTAPEPLPRPKEEPKRPLTLAPASIVLEVPADAIVYFDGNRMKSTSTHRLFHTPPLEPGEDYYYWVRVIIEQGGKKVEEAKRVVVRAGEKVESSFVHVGHERPAVADAARLHD